MLLYDFVFLVQPCQSNLHFCAEIFFFVKQTSKPNAEEVVLIKKNSRRDCFGISSDCHFVKLPSIVSYSLYGPFLIFPWACQFVGGTANN